MEVINESRKKSCLCWQIKFTAKLGYVLMSVLLLRRTDIWKEIDFDNLI